MFFYNNLLCEDTMICTEIKIKSVRLLIPQNSTGKNFNKSKAKYSRKNRSVPIHPKREGNYPTL